MVDSRQNSIALKVSTAGVAVIGAFESIGRAEGIGIKDPINWASSRELVEQARGFLDVARDKLNEAIQMLDEVLNE